MCFLTSESYCLLNFARLRRTVRAPTVTPYWFCQLNCIWCDEKRGFGVEIWQRRRSSRTVLYLGGPMPGRSLWRPVSWWRLNALRIAPLLHNSCLAICLWLRIAACSSTHWQCFSLMRFRPRPFFFSLKSCIRNVTFCPAYIPSIQLKSHQNIARYNMIC